jgi:hypothetical protein
MTSKAKKSSDEAIFSNQRLIPLLWKQHFDLSAGRYGEHQRRFLRLEA